MIGRNATDDLKESVRAIETNSVLIGFLNPDEAIKLLVNSEAISDPNAPAAQAAAGDGTAEDAENTNPHPAQSGARERWRLAREAINVEDTPDDLNNAPVDPLPDDDEINAHLDTFRETAAFQQVIAESSEVDGDEWRFGLVPIDRLVAFQKSVTTDAYEDELPSWDDDPIGLLEFTLPLESEHLLMRNTIQTPQNNLVGAQFISRNPNFGLSEMEVSMGEEVHGAEIRFSLQPSPNFVQVARYQGRHFLKNGYHRVHQLWQSGETHVPCLIRDVISYADTGANDASNFPEQITMDPRPPMVTDFGTEVAAEIKQPATNRAIRVTAETTEYPR